MTSQDKKLLHPKKSLGQHFLKCSWVIPTMTKIAELTKQDTVLEIGPGRGALTYAFAKHASNVIAIEKDESLADILRGNLKEKNIQDVEVISGDILVDFPEIKTPYKIAANIPYYLTARLLRHLLSLSNKPSLIVLIIQKEVAERITATPPRMNLLALSVQLLGTPKIMKTIPRECFSPKPKVASSIIKITPHKQTILKKHQISEEDFFKPIKKAFGQKRKTIGSSLKSMSFSIPDILLKKRPEALSIEDWLTIVKNKA